MWDREGISGTCNYGWVSETVVVFYCMLRTLVMIQKALGDSTSLGQTGQILSYLLPFLLIVIVVYALVTPTRS